MVKSIGAEGYIGVALEDEAGTYQAPNKFFPIRSESLSWTQSTNWRRVIRGTADVIGAVAGNGNVEGDVETELLSDILPYFLSCARGTLTFVEEEGTEPDLVPAHYEFVPAHNAVPPKTMSITVVRSGIAFGYTGIVVSSMAFGVDNDMATSTFSLLGTNEEDVSVPAAPVYTDDEPYGAGQWVIEIPTETQIFDADGFSFEVDDGGEVQFRLKDELGAQFVSFGERNVTLSMDRDFEDRVEYDAFKQLTGKAIRVQIGTDSADHVEFNTPVSIIDTYEVGLAGVGDLVRASVSYIGTHDDETGGGYGIDIYTDEVLSP